MDKEQLEKKLAELQAQLEELVATANRQIGYIQGRIDQLKELLSEEDSE
jgi:hypothetical protein